MLSYAISSPIIRVMSTAHKNESFGERLARLMKERGVTNKQLAEAIGASNQSVISHWRQNRHLPREEMLASVAEHLNVDLVYLVHGQGDDQGTATRIAEAISGMSEEEKLVVLNVALTVAKRHN